MAGNSVVRARIDERTKREAAAALKRIGLTVFDAFRLLLVRIAAEKALPFEPLNPNAETVAAMKAARRCRAETSITHYPANGTITATATSAKIGQPPVQS